LQNEKPKENIFMKKPLLFLLMSFLSVTMMAQLPMTGCNLNTPNWVRDGVPDLGNITWGNTSNTNINSGATTVLGTGGRPNQIWSGAVFAEACNKSTFDGGGDFDNFNADCRQSLHTFNAGRAEGITGDLFSWCAVVRCGVMVRGRTTGRRRRALLRMGVA
jgi:hypothetical protein